MDEDGQDRIDPVTLEVLRNALEATAEEMTGALVRTAHSPNVTERRDCSCAVFDASGELIAQSETIPVHLGAMPFSVRAALERYPPASLARGDALLLNDPFAGGAHLPDVTLVSPVFPAQGDGHTEADAEPNVDGATDGPNGEGRSDATAPIAFVANRAHHADVGGAAAGSITPEATEIYQEGLRIPPVKLREAGASNDAVRDLLLGNTRTPDERRGDLRAQEAANRTGRRRIRDLYREYGAVTFARGAAAIQDYSERRMRAAIADLPDGTYRFTDALDDDGHGTQDVRIAAAISVEGNGIEVDFADSADRTTGPLNAPLAVTHSATYFALRCVTDPDIPPNAGCYRPIEIAAPAGSVVNAEPPAAVVGGNLETSQRIVDVVLGALADAIPERVPAAGQGTMNNLAVGGVDPRDDSPFAFYETQAGGFGGRAGADGMDAVHVHMSNTLNTPVESLETAYPVRVERYELREDSGGTGQFRGGRGVRRDITFRTDATVSVLADRQRTRPYGLHGGGDGVPGEIRRRSGDGEVEVEATGDSASERDPDPDPGGWERLPSKGTFAFAAGETISLRTPGGGGYGDPDDSE